MKRKAVKGREREKDEESMRIVLEKQMCQNCMPTMNVNTVSL